MIGDVGLSLRDEDALWTEKDNSEGMGRCVKNVRE